MSFASYLLARAAGLPPRLNKAQRAPDTMVPMRDGVRLATMRYAPKKKGPSPTILMRLPYGLRGFDTVAELYAERGFHAVVQACRGTAGSEGQFDPLGNEREDGLATLDWLKAQPWFDGRLGLSGPSYLGYAQWAICDALPPHAAMATKVTSAEFRTVIMPGGALNLSLLLSWMQIIEGLRANPVFISQRMLSGDIEKRTLAASMTLPLLGADKRATGREVPFWRRWLVDAFEKPGFWEEMDHTRRLGASTPPNHFISGWFDFMLDQLLRDYATLVSAGQTPYLTIGPWTHISPELQTESIAHTVTWMQAHLEGNRAGLRDKPVRIHIGGRNEWREFDSFPPAPPALSAWHLHPGKGLSPTPAAPSAPGRYRYDPHKPTPSLGGAMFAFTGAGAVDNARLEKRHDVLAYTSAPLDSDLTVIGNVGVRLFARASLGHVDFFVRLNDVDEKGTSCNVCDALVRRAPDDPAGIDGTSADASVWTVEFRLHATAHCFRKGHRLRVLVASGAHPRYARNAGTGEPLATAHTLEACDVEIFHDPGHPSAIMLPICEV